MAETATATTTEGQVPPTVTVDLSSKVATEQVTTSPPTPPADATAEPVPPTEKPVEVAYEFKAPEGHELDPEAMKAFEGIAREIKLPPGDAQKVLESVLPVLQDRWNSGLQNAIDTTRKQWEADLKADKVLGGNNLKATLDAANEGIDAYPGSTALRQLLDQTGLGSNPVFVGWAAWLGKAMKADANLVRGKPGGGAPLTAIERLAMTYDRTE